MTHPLIINYGFHPTSFGECLLATTELGICHLSFVDNQQEALALLQTQWPDATLVNDATQTGTIVRHVFSPSKTKPYHANLHLKGTPFQLQVWDALLELQRGTTITYSDLAQKLGHPQATRAVASAIAQNSVAVIVPCHRVIGKKSTVHKYRWGSERKKALLAWEVNGTL